MRCSVNRSISCAFLLVSSIFQATALADHPTVAFGNEASGPIGTIAATAMPRGAWAMGVRSELINSDQLSDSALASAAEQGIEDVHSIDYLLNTSAALAYGITDDLSVSVRVPWVIRNNIREGEFDDDHGEGEAHGHGDASGLGDLAILGNYRFFQNESVDAAVQFGFKAPSGDEDVSDRGESLETEFQPGSGSWDLLIGGAFSKTHGRWGLHTNILYSKTTEGAQNTEFGDAIFYNAAAIYTLSRGQPHHEHGDGIIHPHLKWDVMLEINGEKRWENEINNARERNSGGSVVYISPGIRLSYKKIGGFISVGIPVIDDTNGLQTDTNWRLVGGFGIAF